MAKILAELPKKASGAGRKPIYPYDEWLDGQIRQLEGGIDFTAKPQSVLASIRQTAKERGMNLRTRYANDGKDVIIQAWKDEPVVVPKSTRRPKTKAGA